MATGKEKSQKYIILIFFVISLLLLGNIVVERNIFDIVYLCVIIAYLVRYLFIQHQESKN